MLSKRRNAPESASANITLTINAISALPEELCQKPFAEIQYDTLDSELDKTKLSLKTQNVADPENTCTSFGYETAKRMAKVTALENRSHQPPLRIVPN